MARPVRDARSTVDAAAIFAGERRQVTALFYDIVDSTRLLQQLDPEDFALVQRRLHSRAAAVIHENCGYFDRLQGDGGSAFFGFPSPSEDAAECAVAAALEIVAWCRALNEASDPQTVLRIRIGIATGTVIVSDTTMGNPLGLGEIVGVAPSLAARLQAEAEPNGILVSDATYLLTRNAFAFAACGERQLKGFNNLVQVWSPVARRLDGERYSPSSDVTPLIGRTDEIALCLRQWERVRAGNGQIVMITGEPGIGKSRLVTELSRHVSDAGCEVRLLHCLARGNARPLHPFIDALKREVRRDRTEPAALEPQEIRDFLHAEGLVVRPETVDTLVFLADHGGRAIADPHLPNLSAQDAKRPALDAILDLLAAWAQRRRGLLVIEDIHWADSLTHMLLADLLERMADIPLLTVLTSRHDLPAGVGERLTGITLPLARLQFHETQRLLEPIWYAAPKGAASFVHEMSEGVPLFAEQLAIFLKERFHDGRSGPRDWRRALQESGIVTLQDLMAARFADLGPARLIAQVASTLGREFHVDLLEKIVPLSPSGPSLGDALQRLEQAGILQRQRHLEGSPYRFRHILLQEAAYGSLLKADRREIHRQIVELVLRESVATPADEIMAWHCEQAGRYFEAARYGIRAAEACAMRSAVQEASQLLDLADSNLSHCGDFPETSELALRLLAARGPVVIATAGKGSAEAREIYERGVAICRQHTPGSRHKWFPLYWGWWYTSPDRSTKRLRSQVLISDLSQAHDPETSLQALHCAWASNFHAGHHHLCMDCIEKGLALYDPERGRVSRVRYGGHDARVCGLGEKAQLLWLMGDPEGADESIRQALEWAEAAEHVGSLCHALDNALLLCCYKGDVQGAAELAQRLRDLADAHDLPEAHAKSLIFAGWASAQQGNSADGLRAFEEGLRTQQSLGTDEDLPVYRSLWADLLMRLGRREQALSVLNAAIDEAETCGNHVWLPELYRQRALLCESAAPDCHAALRDFERAVALAEEQGALALAARARADMRSLENRAPA